MEGMRWLQGTFSVRFNRLRDERGHLFQGRYKLQSLTPLIAPLTASRAELRLPEL